MKDEPSPHGTRPLRIGLTGPIGCGKSTVAGWIADHGGAVIDADVVAREVTLPGGPVHDAILDAFGPAVRSVDGTLDRAALAAIVFADDDRLHELEAIVHPAVRPRILDLLDAAAASGVPVVAVEAIKLIEGGLAELCDEVWLVTCDPLAQRERLEARGATRPDAAARIGAQRDIRERLAPHATRVIDTTGPREDVRPRVEAALAEALDAFGRRLRSG